MNFSSSSAISSFENKSVLVTGGTGFIGSHLVHALVNLGAKTFVLTQKKSDVWRLSDIQDKITFIYGNLCNLDLEDFAQLETLDIVFHLAAAGVNPKHNSSAELTQVNVLGTVKILDIAKHFQVNRFVYCGSCFEYGSGQNLKETQPPVPMSEYAASKSSGWLMTQSFYHRYHLPTVSLRPFTVYGAFESPHRLIPQTIVSALAHADIELTGGEQTRDFVFVEDVVRGFLQAATESEAIGGTFNLCSGTETSVKTLVSHIIKLTNSQSKPRFGAYPYRDTELWELSGNPELSKSVLSWRASISLEQGLSKTIAWFQKNHNRYPAYNL